MMGDLTKQGFLNWIAQKLKQFLIEDQDGIFHKQLKKTIEWANAYFQGDSIPLIMNEQIEDFRNVEILLRKEQKTSY